MKKVFLLAMALCLASTCAMAQKKNVKKANPVVKTITMQSDAKAQTQTQTQEVNAQPQPQEVNEEKVINLPEAEMGLDASLRECFKQRRTIRDFVEEDLPEELLSSLLWSAYGINRPDEGKRVVPSAVNMQEFNIYLFTRERVYRYEAEKNILIPVLEGDHRGEISEQSHFATAPVSILIVADYNRMEFFKKDTETRDFYAAVDCGYVSQNIYLFCAANDLGTVACGGINRDRLHKMLDIVNGKALLAHPVGIHR